MNSSENVKDILKTPNLVTYIEKNEQRGLLFIGDITLGDLFGYKFDEILKKFNQILKISSTFFKEPVYGSNLFSNNELLIYYDNANVFIDLSSCIKNPLSCLKCT